MRLNFWQQAGRKTSANENWTYIADASPFIDAGGYLTEAVGYEGRHGLFETLLLPRMLTPCSVAFGSYFASVSRQRMTLRFYRGLSTSVTKSVHLGDIEILVVPPELGGPYPFDLNVAIDRRRNLCVSAKRPRSGTPILIQRTKSPLPNPKPSNIADPPQRLAYPICVVSLGEELTELIPSGVDLPYTHTEQFANAQDNQTSFGLEFAQARLGAAIGICSVSLGDLPPMPRGRLAITLSLHVSTEKQLTIGASIASCGHQREFGPYRVY